MTGAEYKKLCEEYKKLGEELAGKYNTPGGVMELVLTNDKIIEYSLVAADGEKMVVDLAMVAKHIEAGRMVKI